MIKMELTSACCCMLMLSAARTAADTDTSSGLSRARFFAVQRSGLGVCYAGMSTCDSVTYC